MGEMDGMVEIVPQFALSFGATYTRKYEERNKCCRRQLKMILMKGTMVPRLKIHGITRVMAHLDLDKVMVETVTGRRIPMLTK